MPLESLLGPTVTTWIAHLVAALTAFALLYGAAKVAWTRITGKPFPHNALTRQLDALAELGSNVIGAINKLSPSSPLIANPEVLRRDAMLAEVRAELNSLRALSASPSPDPVAPPLPTPVEPSPVLRAVTVSYRPSAMPPASDDGNAAAYELARREVAAARVFDPLARQTIAPSDLPPRDQGGHVEGAAMLGACIVALAASLLCAGCPFVRDVAMRAAPGVPDPVGCVAGVQRCASGVPVVCSATAREWPTLPRSASGEPRTCAPGACVVSDAGVAYCAPVTDGGAL